MVFYISKSRLCSVSKYFDQLINGDASSSGTKELFLLDDNHHVWQWFQIWLDTGRLRESYDLTESGWINFLTLYFFAEEKFVPKLQNELLDVMGDLIRRVAPNPRMIDLIWSKTSARSALRGLIIEGFVYELYASTVLRCHRYNNPDFLQDLIHYYQDMSAPITSQAFRPFMSPCRYHIHEAGDPPCPQAQGLFAKANNGTPVSNAPRGPILAVELESRFNGTGQSDNTLSMPSIPATSPESNIPRGPVVAEKSEIRFNGTVQSDNTPSISSSPNTPRGAMVADEFESRFNGNGQFVDPKSIPLIPDAWNPGW